MRIPQKCYLPIFNILLSCSHPQKNDGPDLDGSQNPGHFCLSFLLGEKRNNYLFDPEWVKKGIFQGNKIPADPRRGKGICGNDLGSTWEWAGKNIISSDIVSGGGNYYYHRVKVEKA
jgi:hypothetical protein